MVSLPSRVVVENSLVRAPTPANGPNHIALVTVTDALSEVITLAKSAMTPNKQALPSSRLKSGFPDLQLINGSVDAHLIVFVIVWDFGTVSAW